MARGTRVCLIGCAAECRHGVPCVIGSFGGAREGDHEVVRGRRKHGGDDGRWHEWVGDAGTGRCVVSDYDLDDEGGGPITLTLSATDPGAEGGSRG